MFPGGGTKIANLMFLCEFSVSVTLYPLLIVQWPLKRQKGTICSGSAWEVDVETLQPVARLVSPALDAKYGDSFGVQGQIYVTPDEQ